MPKHPAGGNPLKENVNAQYYGWEFEYVYQVILGCFVFLIVPGLGLLYGGMARRKSALAMIFQSLTVMAVISFQWTFWGFTLAFSRTGSPFIGDMSNFGLIDVRGLHPKLCREPNADCCKDHGSTLVGICIHP